RGTTEWPEAVPLRARRVHTTVGNALRGVPRSSRRLESHPGGNLRRRFRHPPGGGDTPPRIQPVLAARDRRAPPRARAIRLPGDAVGECAADVKPELPAVALHDAVPLNLRLADQFREVFID